jgi:hypothetical protein
MAFKKYRLIHVLPVTLIGLYFLVFTYPPFQDYPNLLYQGFVFNEYAFHGNAFGGYFQLYPYVPPNAISTVVLGLMDLILDPFIAGKIYLIILGVALYSAIVQYLKFHSKSRTAFISISAFYLTFNLHFISAYLNFETGLAFILLAIVFIRKKGYESNIIALALVMIIAYLCHFLALILLTLYFIVYFVSKKDLHGVLNLAGGSVPVVGLSLHYLIMRSIPNVSSVVYIRTFFHVINGKFLTFFSPIIPFHQLKWVFEATPLILTLDYIFSICIFILIVFILIHNIQKKQYTLEFWLAAISLLIAFALPLYLGGVLLPGERFVVFCMLNIFVLVSRVHFNHYIRKYSIYLFSIIAFASFSYLIYGTILFNTMVKQGDIPEEAILHPEKKREGTNGFLHFKYYDAIKNRTALPVFSTGLFAFPDSSSLGATSAH